MAKILISGPWQPSLRLALTISKNGVRVNPVAGRGCDSKRWLKGAILGAPSCTRPRNSIKMPTPSRRSQKRNHFHRPPQVSSLQFWSNPQVGWVCHQSPSGGPGRRLGGAKSANLRAIMTSFCKSFPNRKGLDPTNSKPHFP